VLGNDPSAKAVSLIAIATTSLIERVVVRDIEGINTVGFAGVYFQNVEHGLIENCHFYYGDHAGIQVQGRSRDITIQGNLVHEQ
jgi:parallel beta helix pectate lyase-like protein